MENTTKNLAQHPRGGLKIGALAVLAAGALIWALLPPLSPGQESGQTAGQSAQDKWTVESHDRTNFPLQGKHRSLSCRECHINTVFEGTPADCEACHWQRRNDDRYELRLGIHCAECHTPFTWKRVDPGKWSHEFATGFPLEGIHRTLDCADCHGDRGFTGRPTDCFACHQDDYEGTREPDHAAAGFPTTCQDCHSPRGWEASFTHSSFPLEGRHRTLACSECHVNGVYAGTPTDCFACHQDDYNSTSDPNHIAAAFPTTCDACHSASNASWDQASFNHTFPITSGRHSGFSCTECHTTSNYQQFNCLDCHAHEKSSMDSQHSSIGGYVYSSSACYACHPRGSG